MNCQNIIKGKKGPVHCNSKLQTVRTKENGKTTHRERRCPKCKSRYFTTECYDTDLKEERAMKQIALDSLEEELIRERQKHQALKKGLRDFHSLIDITG